MKLHAPRPSCRAPNRFSTSTFLYQHFVVSCNVAIQQRFSSSAAEPTASTAPESLTLAEAMKPSSSFAGKTPLRFFIKNEREEIPKLKNDHRRGSLPWRARESEIRAHELLVKTQSSSSHREAYTGVHMRPHIAPMHIPPRKLPWVANQSPSGADGMARLNHEIQAFYDYAKPSRAEEFARKNLIEEIRADMRRYRPDYVLEVFGSERTGLALALSDIDLLLIRRGSIEDEAVSNNRSTREERVELLRELYRIRKNVFKRYKNQQAAPKYNQVELLYARYPLISVRDRPSGLDLQIVWSTDTTKQREVVQHYLMEYPYLRQVYAVVRTLFEQRELSNVFIGGFGSYSIFMMIVASLQQQDNKRKDAAGALLNFLYYWGYFKTDAHGVSIDPPEYFDKTEHPVADDATIARIAEGRQQPRPRWMLSLRDPADKTNDLGRKGTSILHLQATLRDLTSKLIESIKVNNKPSLLLSLVGEVYPRHRQRRAQLAKHGKQIENLVQSSLSAAAEDARAGEHDDVSPEEAPVNHQPEAQEGEQVPSGEASVNHEPSAQEGEHNISSSEEAPAKPQPSAHE